MGKAYASIDGRLRKWIESQPVFFTATAPLAADGRDLSPKGWAGTLGVLDESTLACPDFGGSHAETIAHLRENGRITLMRCVFGVRSRAMRTSCLGQAWRPPSSQGAAHFAASTRGERRLLSLAPWGAGVVTVVAGEGVPGVPGHECFARRSGLSHFGSSRFSRCRCPTPHSLGVSQRQEGVADFL